MVFRRLLLRFSELKAHEVALFVRTLFVRSVQSLAFFSNSFLVATSSCLSESFVLSCVSKCLLFLLVVLEE